MVFLKAKRVITIAFLITILSNTISSRSEVKYQGNARVVLADTSTGQGWERDLGSFCKWLCTACLLFNNVVLEVHTAVRATQAAGTRYSHVDELTVSSNRWASFIQARVFEKHLFENIFFFFLKNNTNSSTNLRDSGSLASC